MDIFDFAMQKEKYSEGCYRRLAAQTANKGLQNIFTMLADEEVKHYHTVEKMKNATGPELHETQLLAEAKSVFQQMKRAVENFDFTLGELDAYKGAQKIEEESRDFYLEKTAAVEDQNHKEIFQKLADEENKHYFLLQNIIEFVSRPETWLENAEFNHLDEY